MPSDVTGRFIPLHRRRRPHRLHIGRGGRMHRPRIRMRYGIAALAAVTVGVAGFIAAPSALAAGESVNVWLTTTSDAGGRTVTRGLAQQPALTFTAGAGSGQAITVNDATRYQTFT